jgi:hypothetical protein
MTPKKRGRPPKYANNEERREADAQRKRDERDRARGNRKTKKQKDLNAAKRRLPLATGLEAVKLANRILVAEGLGMSRGMFLTDAPRGQGLLVFGLPKREVNLGRVQPRGHGSEDKNFLPVEFESQFIEKYFRDTSSLRCYRKECLDLVVGILPQDWDKPLARWRFHCYLHSPIWEFPGRFPNSAKGVLSLLKASRRLAA